MNAIRVTFDIHAPHEWDTPVPVELFDEAMQSLGKPHVLNLAAGGMVDVQSAGRYYVLATLPTGESVGASVDVKSGDAMPADAVLVSRESSPWESLAWAFTRQRLPQETERKASRSADRLLFQEGFRGWQSLIDRDLSGPGLRSILRSNVEILGMTDGRGEWALQRTSDEWSWNDAVLDADPRLLGQLTLTRLPAIAPPPPGTNLLWYPRFVRYRVPSRRGPPIFTLVAVPAGQAVARDPRRESIVLFTWANALSAYASPVRALVHGARDKAETLLSYLENGVFAAVHQLGADIVGEAATLLSDKLEDPFGASIAGYVLLRTDAHLKEQRDWRKWMRNLADWFPLIPDGAVIYGASLLDGRDADVPGRVDEARSYLLEAVSRGIPTYTMGLRLLFDSIRLLAEDRGADDTELAAALAKVRSITAYADWTAQTTTLWYPGNNRWRGSAISELAATDAR